jgi:hypothetical protein
MISPFFSRRAERTTQLSTPSSIHVNVEQIELRLSQVNEFIKRESSQATINGNGHVDFSEINSFNIANPLDRAVLNEVHHNYQTKLAQLKQFDTVVASSFLIGITGLALSTVFPALVLLLAVPAFCYGSYKLGQRDNLFSKYQQALVNLKTTYIWCLNDTQASVGAENEILDLTSNDDAFGSMHTDVQQLVSAAAPMLSDKELLDFTRNDIDHELKQQLDDLNAEAINEQTTTKAQQSLNYLLYGSHQGSEWQVLRGVFMLSRDAVVNGATSVWSYLNGQSDNEPTLSAISRSH